MADLWNGWDAATLDRQFNARASVPCFEAEQARYQATSDRVRAAFVHETGLVYDPASGQTLDFYPAGPGAPLFIWVHGGYWRGGSARDNAFVVAGLHRHGFAVAVLDYSLAPAVTIDEITRQVRAATGWLHRHRVALGLDDGPFVIGGSSAGGHLVGMLLAEGWQAPFGLPSGVIGTALALSGLYWLEPLRHTHIDGWMRFDDGQIARNSPALLIPAASDARLILSVGGLEPEGFRIQTARYGDLWAAAGHRLERIAMPAHHHFDIALSLSDPDSVLAAAVARAHRGTAAPRPSGAAAARNPAREDSR